MSRVRLRAEQRALDLAASSTSIEVSSPRPTSQLGGAPIIAILRLPQVCRVTGLCRSLVYELEASGRFPQRVTLGRRSVGWVESEIQAWLAARVAARHSTTVKAAPVSRSVERIA